MLRGFLGVCFRRLLQVFLADVPAAPAPVMIQLPLPLQAQQVLVPHGARYLAQRVSQRPALLGYAFHDTIGVLRALLAQLVGYAPLAPRAHAVGVAFRALGAAAIAVKNPRGVLFRALFPEFLTQGPVIGGRTVFRAAPEQGADAAAEKGAKGGQPAQYPTAGIPDIRHGKRAQHSGCPQTADGGADLRARIVFEAKQIIDVWTGYGAEARA